MKTKTTDLLYVEWLSCKLYLYCLMMVILTKTCHNRKNKQEWRKIGKKLFVDGINSDPHYRRCQNTFYIEVSVVYLIACLLPVLLKCGCSFSAVRHHIMVVIFWLLLIYVTQSIFMSVIFKPSSIFAYKKTKLCFVSHTVCTIVVFFGDYPSSCLLFKMVFQRWVSVSLSSGKNLLSWSWPIFISILALSITVFYGL
jgi:hypothetical protein